MSSPTFPRPSAFGPTLADDSIAGTAAFAYDDDTAAFVVDFLTNVGDVTVFDPRGRERVRAAHALLARALSADESWRTDAWSALYRFVATIVATTPERSYDVAARRSLRAFLRENADLAISRAATVARSVPQNAPDPSASRT